MAFVGWESRVSVAGETANWTAATDRRPFYPACGSAPFATCAATGAPRSKSGRVP